MNKKQIKASYQDGNKAVKLTVSIFLWEEDSIHYVYSPALDLTGYGKSVAEAKESFEVVLDEFVVYTHNKKTIFNELEKLGWAVNKRKKKVVSPDFEELLNDNKHFNYLYKTKQLVKESSNISLALT